MSTNPGPWRKSSFSDTGSSCVEVQALSDGGRRVRDTKDKGTGPILSFTESEWRTFLTAVRTGEFDA